MADKDKLVKVGQLDTVVDEIVNKFGETNGRLTQQAETIEDLTMRLSEAEALLSIARGEGGS
jgi:hypothetical protein